MTDVLIRMEMPDNCISCDMFIDCDGCEGHRCLCALLGSIGYIENVPRDKRLEECPLVELPEHGDLISREQAFQMMLNRGYQKEAAGVILEVPTVIPASEEAADENP